MSESMTLVNISSGATGERRRRRQDHVSFNCHT